VRAGDTEAVMAAERAWREQVQSASLRGDGEELLRLFALAHELFGDDASEKWAEALSAFDSSAVTG
jgi:hypothetical protein